ncbi:MAG: uroporphyrinogen-III C-methyltransferase, partial [Verrucomicrobiales bacterium]
VSKALEGKVVVRHKGGDPLLFGRGGEEAQALKAAGISFEFVSGVSSALAGPAYAGIPVTHRGFNSKLTIITGHENPEKGGSAINYDHLSKTDGTIVMLMGVGHISTVSASLLEHGAKKSMPVALIRWATTGRQETLIGTLETIADLVEKRGFKAPAVTVFGDVVNLRSELNWFEDRPLFGKRIVVTRTRKQAGQFSGALQSLGADILELPTIRVEPPKDILEFGRLVQEAHSYDWLIFSSPNGAEAFFEMFYKIYSDARELGGARIAAMGPGTAGKIRDYRFTVDLMPENYVAESLVEAFEKEIGSVENLTMLWARAEKARDVISKRLTQLGAILDEGIAYRTVPETEDLGGGGERFRQEGADILTFTSSSTVESFLRLGLPLPENLVIASIGPITSKTLHSNGLYVDIEAREHDIPGLVEAIRQHYQS